MPDPTGTAIEPVKSVVIKVDPKVIHPAGTPGELLIVSSVLALNPVAESHIATPVVAAGASATPELTSGVPRVTVAFDVMVNDAVATIPRVPVTVINWLPATKLAVRGAAVTMNWNTVVPCSVFIGVAGTNGEIVVRVAPFPI